MAESPYQREAAIVQQAIAWLRSEADPNLIAELEEEQRAAGTGLEWYGITMRASGGFPLFLGR